jgi:hypothetical protein
MRNVFTLIFFTLICASVLGQTDRELYQDAYNNSDLNPEEFRDSLQLANEKMVNVEIEGETHFTDYKIISHSYDTTFVDTTLNINKYNLFNFVRKDDFELMAFQNQGQTYNKLGYNFNSKSIIPEMGMTGKYYNYKEIEDVKYYNVPTPTSELFFRSGLEQGQTMDAFVTMNTSPNLNFSFAFKGIRSLGKYRRSLVSNRNFRTTINYKSENKKYFIRSHFVAHKYFNEESGGLTPLSDEFFRAGDNNYSDRGRLDINFTDAENELLTKRYYIEHNYKLLEEKDSIKTKLSNLTIGHSYTYDTKRYNFSMTQNDLLGSAFESNINDNTGLKEMDNQLYLEINSPIVLGRLRVKGNYYKFDHFFNGIVYLPGQIIDQNMSGNALSAGAEWDTQIKKFKFKANVSSILSGDLEGNNLSAETSFKIDSISMVKASISTVSKSPNFIFLHSQSDYIDYNWQNDTFKNEQIRNLSFEFISDKWVHASASISQIDNYTYFNANSAPTQGAEALNYLKVKVSKDLQFGKFGLDNSFMYNNISKGQTYFRTPEFITRNSFYFADHLFKGDPLFLQAGITFKYFTKYFMNRYNPLLSEFVIQDTEEFGNFPVFDIFVNAQVQRTRLYFKLENVTSNLTGRNYYSAPSNPYRDFTIRFGLVWNFFL